MISLRGLLAATAINAAMVWVLAVGAGWAMFGAFAGGLAAGLVARELAGGAATGALAAVLGPPVGAVVAVLLALVALVGTFLFGDARSAGVAVRSLFFTVGLSPVFGVAGLLAYLLLLVLYVPLGILGGLVGGLAGRALPRTA